MVACERQVDHLTGADRDLGNDLARRGSDRVCERYNVVLLRHTRQADDDRVESQSFLRGPGAVRYRIHVTGEEAP